MFSAKYSSMSLISNVERHAFMTVSPELNDQCIAAQIFVKSFLCCDPHPTDRKNLKLGICLDIDDMTLHSGFGKVTLKLFLYSIDEYFPVFYRMFCNIANF